MHANAKGLGTGRIARRSPVRADAPDPGLPDAGDAAGFRH